MSHYCRTCKRTVPLAAGTLPNPVFSVGVSHVGGGMVVSRSTLGMGDLWIHNPCPDANHRTYAEDEQLRNLREMDIGCEIAPPGWVCARETDHDGPCAAVPVCPSCTSTETRPLDGVTFKNTSFKKFYGFCCDSCGSMW